jgi:hypothetical protein
MRGISPNPEMGVGRETLAIPPVRGSVTVGELEPQVSTHFSQAGPGRQITQSLGDRATLSERTNVETSGRKEEWSGGARPRTALPSHIVRERGDLTGQSVAQYPTRQPSSRICPVRGARESTPDTSYQALPSKFQYAPGFYAGGGSWPGMTATQTSAEVSPVPASGLQSLGGTLRLEREPVVSRQSARGTT